MGAADALGSDALGAADAGTVHPAALLRAAGHLGDLRVRDCIRP